MFPTALLLTTALMFAAFGVWLLVDPGRLEPWLGLHASRPEARTELRAFYGGLEIGLAVFLVLCAARSHWQAAGLAAIAAVNGGIAVARIVGFVADGSFSGKLLTFLLVELGLALAAGIALARLPSATTA